MISYLELGIHHIWDISAFDHLLFVASLVIAYTWQHWKTVAMFLTAFTIGHAISMLLVIQGWVPIPIATIEALIPWTILISGLYHMWSKQRESWIVYLLILLFGCIHGMAYGAELAQLLSGILDPVFPILGFNLGVEIAQITIAAILLLAMTALQRWASSRQRDIVRYCIFGIIISLSLFLILS
jgi:hydrogenase/urease accessory protein HupE